MNDRPGAASASTASGAAPTLAVDRPPEGPARGVWAAPSWAIAALGIGVSVAAAAWMARLRRTSRP
ncbi:MAG: hypothetical protein IT376_13990 [Polyangiaceae bacterium]|nr:hypothetical protein [Polyangiaceae bacterium]